MYRSDLACVNRSLTWRGGASARMAQQTTLSWIFVPAHRVVYKNASNSYERFVNRFVADFTRETQLHGAIAAANALWPSYKDDPKKNSLNFWKEEKRELQLVTEALAFVSYLKDQLKVKQPRHSEQTRVMWTQLHPH